MVICFLLLVVQNGFSQKAEIDSIKTELLHQKGYEKVASLNELSWYYKNFNVDSALILANQALEIMGKVARAAIAIFDILLPSNNVRIVLVTITAENKLTRIPSSNKNANPCTKEDPTKKRISVTKIVVRFPSRIDGQARVNPSWRAFEKLFPIFSSSRILEKIRIFASTAIPTDKITPANPSYFMSQIINL